MKQTSWLSTTFSIASIFSFRMLGLFMLIPVFTIYAPHLHGATPTLIGVALGTYGLSQGLLQLPMGILSDYWGRKPVLTIGLILFAVGSIYGAITDSIYGMIIARVLQGSGAVGSVLIALLADLTPDGVRTKAMAIIGMTIALSFSIAMLISPVLAQEYGLQSIFLLTTCLAILGLIILYRFIPFSQSLPSTTNQSPITRIMIFNVIKNKRLLQLNGGIFCQHLILTQLFYVLPLLLKQQVSVYSAAVSWHFYLPILLLSFVIMLAIITYAERFGRMRSLFLMMIIATSLSQISLAILPDTYWFLFANMSVYFIAFNFLEAVLPSFISRQADPNAKGTAMGIYSSCQFLGIFAGGALAGTLSAYFSTHILFFTNAVVGFLWLLLELI